MNSDSLDRLLRLYANKPGFDLKNRAHRTALIWAILKDGAGVERLERAIHKYAQIKGLKRGVATEMEVAWLIAQMGLSWRQIARHLETLNDGEHYRIVQRRGKPPIITILSDMDVVMEGVG